MAATWRARGTVVVAVLALMAGISAVAAPAFAGTITVKLSPHKVYYQGQYWNHISPARVHVYGPSGYYRADSIAGSALPAGVPFVANSVRSFSGAPLGSYRVRIVSSALMSCRAADWSWYFGTWFLGPNYTVNYTSP
jgi:hypothetical protein